MNQNPQPGPSIPPLPPLSQEHQPQPNQVKPAQPQPAQPQPNQPNQQQPQPQKKNNKQLWIIIALAGCLPVLVIAGILGAMVLVSLGSARDRAREASGKATVSSIPAAMAVCADEKGTLQPPVANTKVCTSVNTPAMWPTLTEGWTYGQLTSTNPETATFGVTCSVPSCKESITMTCTITGCREL